MNEQVLAELVQIKWGIVAIFSVIAIMVLYFIIATAMRIRQGNTEALLMLRESYLAELSLLDSKGDFDTLLEKSEEMVAMFPNDLLANYYSGIANYRNKQYAAALSALGRVKQINNSWSAEAVDALIDDIKAEMDGPKAV